MNELEKPSVELVAERSNKKWKVAARINGEIGFLDTINPSSATQRAKFVKAVTDKFPAVPADAIEAELLKIGTAPETPVRPAAGSAPSGSSVAELLAATPADILADAESILRDPDLVRRVCDDIAALGVAGERELGLTIYFIGASRRLPKPLAGIIRGSSSSGKSYIVEQVASLFPPEALILATQMTPQALFHMPPDSLRNKWVVAGERSRVEDDERAEATRALREILSSGRLSKLMPVKKEGAKIETAMIVQEGPIAFTETTTLSTIFEEDANRCLILGTDERPEQTQRIIAELASRHSSPAVHSRDRVRLIHHALQRMLPCVEVRVPFADRIGERFGCGRVEVRRAFPQLLALIQASALLHFKQRETSRDGVLLANATDYQIASRLISRPFALSLGGGVSDPALSFFERLKVFGCSAFTTREAKKLGSGGKSSVHGWLLELHDAGAVEVLDPARGRKPATWKLTGSDPSPGAGIIPELEDVFPEHRKHGHNENPAESDGK
ncbi:MAG: hypothetical protein U0791_10915 [Gemmataceae bacterium]